MKSFHLSISMIMVLFASLLVSNTCHGLYRSSLISQRATRLFMQGSNSFSTIVAPHLLEDHIKFLGENAKVAAPKRLGTLLNVLSNQGLELLSPSARGDLNPLLIPLAKNHTDASTVCFLRWPTQKEGADIPIVQTNEMGVELLAMSTDHYCHRQVVEMDYQANQQVIDLASALNRDGQLYNVGDYMFFFKTGKFPIITAQEQRLALDRFLLTKVGPFPDCYERLAENFLAQKNEISALVTCERAVNVFYGYGRPVSFHAQMLIKLGRLNEAKDTARSALHLPKWTIASSKKEMEIIAQAAGFTDSKILGEMHAIRSQDPREKDKEEGVSPQQISLDQAAHLMDAVALGAVEGGWIAAKKDLAQKYRDGGYPEIAAFIEV